MKKIILLSALMAGLGFVACTGNTEKAAETAATNSDAVIENIMTRVSVREFTEQPVSKDTLDLLVKAGMAAPSAVNKQPWAFVVVTDREVLDSLNSVKEFFNLKTATAAIVVCGDLDKAMEGEGQQYWVQDCCAATENILLAAHAYGLGAVWCGVYPIQATVDGVKRVLDLPENIVPLDVITLGYPAENPEPKDKFKEENIHYNRW